MVRHSQCCYINPSPHPPILISFHVDWFPETKIAVANPVVELDGDEMTRIIWKKIREEVRFALGILPLLYAHKR